jgi:hypothetical protein
VFNVAATLSEVVFSIRTFLMVSSLIWYNKLLRTLVAEFLEFIELKLKHDPKEHFARATRFVRIFARVNFSLGLFSFILNGIVPACYQLYRFLSVTANAETYLLPFSTK